MFIGKNETLEAIEELASKEKLLEAMVEVDFFCLKAKAERSKWETFENVAVWSYTTVELQNGNKYRLGCSDGGIIAINGRPIHPNGSSLRTWEQVADMFDNHVDNIPFHEVSYFNES